MPDIGYDEQQLAFAKVLAEFCADHTVTWAADSVHAAFPREAWDAVAELGVLGLTAVDSGAGALDVLAAHEALGYGGCPGPLWATALAVATLPEPDLDAVASGRVVVSVAVGGLLPWAENAGMVLDTSDLTSTDGIVWRCEVVDVEREFAVLGRERWAQVRLARQTSLAVDSRTRALADLALGGYLVGATARVLADVVAYVSTRRQFKKPLSDFQAVAHPLAECDAHRAAAAGLLRRAAGLTDETNAAAPRYSGIALASASRAARNAVYQAHQAYGGIGFAEEGPLAWLGARIGQLSTEAEAGWRRRSAAELIGATGPLR